MKKPLFSLILIAVTAGLFTGCGDNSVSSDGDTGTLRVLLTDAPAAFDAVNVTFSSVSVHSGDEESGVDSVSGWITVSNETKTINLLSLSNGLTSVLGEAALDPAHYTQLRLAVTSAEVVIDSVAYQLVIPSDTLKFVCGFDVAAGGSIDLVVDFDAARSVHQTGSGTYKLVPTVRVLQSSGTGSIGGTVTNYTNRPVAYAIASADTLTATQVDPETGRFTLAYLPVGTYSVVVSDTLGLSYTNSAVTVTASAKTSLGSITLQ